MRGSRLGALALAVVAAFSFGLCRSRWVYHWDGALFTLAIGEFNVARGEPHPPGYFLYVMAARLLNTVIGDPHASLVWLSVLAGAALVFVVCTTATEMFGRRAGVAAALFVMSSPQVWFHSSVALGYIVNSLAVCGTIWWGWRAIQHRVQWSDAIVLGAWLAGVAGVRLQAAPELVPLVAYTLCRAREMRLRKILAAAATATVAGLCWFTPMVWMSGGWGPYWESVRRVAVFNAPLTLLGGGWEAFTWNVFRLALFGANGLMLGAVVLLGGLVARLLWLSPERKQAWDTEHADALRLLAWWLAPVLVADTVLGFTRQPGFVLTWLPGALLLAAAVVACIESRAGFVAVTAAVCAVNLFAFLAWPSGWDGVFFGTARTAREIRTHDRQLQRTVTLLRARYDPARTILCHAEEYFLFGLRHFQVCAPEFEQVQLTPDPTLLSPPGKNLPAVRGGRLVFTDALPRGDGRRLVLVVPPGCGPEIFRRHFGGAQFRPVPEADGLLYELAEPAGGGAAGFPSKALHGYMNFFATRPQEPVEKRADDAEHQRAADGGPEAFDVEAGDEPTDQLEHRGIDHQRKQSEREHVERQRERQHERAHVGVDQRERDGGP